jgi:hypothetical protein
LPATPLARQFRVAGQAHNDRQPHRGTHWHALPVLPGRTGLAALDPYRAGAAAPPWCPCARPGTHHATFVGARRASPAAPHGAAKQRYVPAPRDGHVTPAIDARRRCVCRLLRAGLTGPDVGQRLTPAEQGQEREGVRGWQIEHGRRNTRAWARPVKPARRRATHRAVDHPLDHQQEEGPLGSLTHQVGSHHTRSVHDTARPRIQRVVVQPAPLPQPATWRCAIPSSPAGPCRGICRAPGAAGRRTASPLQGDAIHPRSGMSGPRWVRPPVW